MAKRRIIYESEGEDSEDRVKKSRVAADDAPLAAAGARRSERTGRGSGGRLAQMKQIEQIQTERTDRSKRLSKIDIATQGEDVNPMAPSSQDIGSGSRRGRPPSERVTSQTEEPPVTGSRLPEFLQAGPGEQFGFRVPSAAPQPEINMRAPARARFRGVHSQASSQGSIPPSSRSASLFSNGGRSSTAPTSHAPSVCSFLADQNFARLDVPASQHAATSSLVDAPSRPPSTRLQRTVSFYDQPLRMNESSHSLFATPGDEAGLEIDEVSPSEDDRIAEANLHRAEHSRGSPLPDDAHLLRRSLSPDLFRGESLYDDDNEPNGATVRYQQSQHSARLPNDHAPSQTHSQSCDAIVRTHRRDSVLDSDDGIRVDGATSHANQPSQHATRPSEEQGLNQSSLQAQPSEDIVNIHRRRNRAPHLPSNSQLLAARQRQQALSATGSGPGEAPGNGDGQDRPTVDCPCGLATERSEPWQLHYYDPATRDIIERAKQFSHCDAASINPFPVRAAFNSKAVEYIDEAIVERRSRGLIVSDGWWPQRESDIARLLWEDLGSWRSALRKKARTFVSQRYQWDTENRRDRNVQIAKDLLGNGGLFLRDGVDAEGHANNLAHPALSGLIVDFFYTGPTSVGKLFPEVFAAEVPRVTVAIAATALKVALDEVAAGQGEVNFRVNTYTPVYSEILGLMSKCDTSVIHRAKTSGLRQRWAQLGSNGMGNQEPAAVGCGFDVTLD